MLIGRRLCIGLGVIAHRLVDWDRDGRSQCQPIPRVQFSEARRNLGRFLLFPFLLFTSQGFHIKNVPVLEVGGYEFTDPAEHALAPPHCATDSPGP